MAKAKITHKLKTYMDRRESKRERILKKVEKEDFLLSQIDEFREKAKQLQNLLATKENKVQQLQEIVEEREGKAKELSEMLDESQDVADRVVVGAKNQIQELIDQVDAKMKELNETFAERLAENAVNSSEQADELKKLIDSQNEEVRKIMDEQSDKIAETIGSVNEQFDKIKNDINDKIHNENVKCYRNIQTLFEESDKKMDLIRAELTDLSSVKTFAKVLLAIGVVNFAVLGVFICYALGLF